MIHPLLLPEWAPQESVLLAWPHADSDWSDTLADIEKVYCELVWSICHYQAVLILCLNEAHQAKISDQLSTRSSARYPVHFVHAPYNDTWVRDYGPLSVCRNGQVELLNFRFNAWGNKYNSELDNHVNCVVAGQKHWPEVKMHTIDFVLEGGSIETDGSGTLLTTTQCLMNSNRNPGYTKNTIEDKLRNNLGIERILWLDHGYLAGDDTDSHIDTLARFCNDSQIVYMSCQQESDEHYSALKNMENELKQFTTKDQTSYQLTPIEIPPAIHHPEGYRLPASYVNYLVINDAVLVPTYRSPEADENALATLAEIFPQRQMIAIDCYPMIMQHGSLHCATMQLYGRRCNPASQQ